MYRIALCDDEPVELDKTERMLDDYCKQRNEYDFLVERFTSAGELLLRIEKREYAPDLLLMDIYMPEIPGIEAAKKLREMGNTCQIIFLTTSVDYALEAFRVDAAQYLVKPVCEEDFFSALDKIRGDLREEREKYLLLRVEGRICRIAIKDIVYGEAQRKCQCLHLTDGTQCLLWMTMAEIWEMLSGYPEFVKVGVAYIINLEHLESMNAREVRMDRGQIVYLPRGSYQPLREQYFRYYCEED